MQSDLACLEDRLVIRLADQLHDTNRVDDAAQDTRRLFYFKDEGANENYHVMMVRFRAAGRCACRPHPLPGQKRGARLRLPSVD